ncbi:hypothetical protein [Trichlorobacter lovleyi]|uniref:hypothetical protein n=1 Tax=Trichlorobacter lovleyi TaxID=313985 RepID=UPI00247FF744|nr:hypothetical protein [Trichlorobacter lovleyi]
MYSRHCTLNIQTNGNTGITNTFGIASCSSRSADANGEYIAANGGRMIVDFSHTTRATENIGQSTSADSNNRPQNTRRLPFFLSQLIGNPDFLLGPITVTVPGHGEFPVAELFVNFADVTPEHVGHFCGYWGRITHTGVDDGNCLYYNSGDNDAVSVLLDKKYFDETKKRVGTLTLNGAVETYMLVFGTLSVSERGKKIIKITDQNYFHLRVIYR